MSQGKAIIEGALNGYLPSVLAPQSLYEALPVGPLTEGILRRIPGHTWGDRGDIQDTVDDHDDASPPIHNSTLPLGYDPAEYMLDQSDETCVPLGYRAGSNIRTPRG